MRSRDETTVSKECRDQPHVGSAIISAVSSQQARCDLDGDTVHTRSQATKQPGTQAGDNARLAGWLAGTGLALTCVRAIALEIVATRAIRNQPKPKPKRTRTCTAARTQCQ